MISIPFIYFTLLAIYLIRKHGGVDISAFIVLIYAFSAGCSILVDLNNVYDIRGVYEKIPISPMATLIYCFLITLSILPFSTIQSTQLKQINLQKEWLLDLVAWILIGTFVITLYNTTTNIEVVLQSNLKDVRDDLYAGRSDVKLTGIAKILAIPETLFSQFSPVALLLYFINIAKERKSKLFNLLLFLSSLTPVVKAIMIAGRTQPIYWFLSFSALYIFCRPLLDKKQRRQSLRPFVISGAAVALFIAAVTIARFAAVGVQNDSGAYNSLIAYSGQSFINFNYFFCNYTARGIHFDRIFPLTNYFVLHPGWDLSDYRDMIMSFSGLNIGVFFTFLGDLLIDLGPIGMTIYVIIFAIIVFFVCRTANQNGTINMSRFLVILILFLIPLQGVFYYSYYKINVGYFVVGTLFICWMLSHTLKGKYES